MPEGRPDLLSGCRLQRPEGHGPFHAVPVGLLLRREHPSQDPCSGRSSPKSSPWATTPPGSSHSVARSRRAIGASRQPEGNMMSGTQQRQGGEPLLVAEQVRKVYRTGEIEVEALAGLDLTVHRGELVAVMGPSGSGKTTLLNCLSGLDDIDGGRVLVDGQDLFALSDARRTAHRARSMGFIFQAFNLIPVFTPAENVELPLLLGGTPAKQARRRSIQMLERVGLSHRVGHRPNELSGGERQRGTGARALASRPAIVWADEPTGNLDTQMASQVVDLLHELNRDDGQTIVLVTHDPGVAASAGRLIRMCDGRLVGDERQSGDGRWTGRGRPPPRGCRGGGLIRMYPNLTPPLAVLLGLALAVAAFIALRRPVLRRLALRQIGRRRGEATLVVAGSVLGTAIIIGSLIVGDTLNFSVKQAAYDNLGPIDEYVSAQTVAQGDQAARRIERLRGDPDIDGVLSLRGDQAAVV